VPAIEAGDFAFGRALTDAYDFSFQSLRVFEERYERPTAEALPVESLCLTVKVSSAAYFRRSVVARNRTPVKVAAAMFRAPATSVLHRVIALSCVMGMLCSASGLLPAFAVVLGQLDSDHHVVVAASAEGLQIRFQHESDIPAHKPSDGQPTATNGTDSHHDHLIQFASTGDSVAQVTSFAAFDHSLRVIAATSAERWIPVARASATVAHARPPPDEATCTRCLRSVVLLV
jgi:hypothetical protein